jgi:hypothetical protein
LVLEREQARGLGRVQEQEPVRGLGRVLALVPDLVKVMATEQGLAMEKVTARGRVLALVPELVRAPEQGSVKDSVMVKEMDSDSGMAKVRATGLAKVRGTDSARARDWEKDLVMVKEMDSDSGMAKVRARQRADSGAEEQHRHLRCSNNDLHRNQHSWHHTCLH